MIRLTFTVLCLLSLPAAVSAESDPWQKAIQSASQAYDSGHYQEAKKLFEQAVEESEAFPSKDLRRAETKINLAGTLLELGEYLVCEQTCLRTIEFLGRHHPEEKSQIARAELVLTKLYLNLRLFRLAGRHSKYGLKLMEAAGLKPLEQAEFQTLAGKNRWEPEQARRAVSIAETVYSKQHPRYAKCLSKLATAYRHDREFEKSEQLSQQAIEILSKTLGKDHPEIADAVENLAWIERSRGHTSQAAEHLRKSIRLRFSTLSDEDLCYFFQQVLKTELTGRYDEHTILEMYLTEMSRRGGSIIEAYLTNVVNEKQRQMQMARRMLQQLQEGPGDDLWDETEDRLRRESDNLEILTALRRAQQKPDPLKIFIKEHDKEVSCVFPDLPVLEVAIRNVDVEKREVGFTEGGDYRSGRQARWRIDVTDAKGRMYEPRSSTSWIGGGLFQPSTLKAGEGWQTWLAMENFVVTLPPGEYQMRIGYHNQYTIVSREFTEDLIVSRSDPIKLTVKPRRITVTKEQQQTIDKILPQLDERLPVKIIGGKYGPWAHEFIKRESPYGRLLSLDWSAVPSLLDELQREKQTPERRAHLLALLYSITGENNPAGGRFAINSTNALGDFSNVYTGWSTWGQREGEEGGGGGFGGSSDPAERKGKLDRKKQEPFVRKWEKLSQHLKVVHED